MVGGLLSAHHASRRQAPAQSGAGPDRRACSRPSPKSPTGMPYRFVNLKTGAVRDPESCPAEVGSYLPEYGTLAKLTGDKRFYDIPKAATKAMFDRRSKLDLAGRQDRRPHRQMALAARPPSARPRTAITNICGTPGSYSAMLTHKQWYDVCTAAILKHGQDMSEGRLWFPRIDYETGKILNHHQSRTRRLLRRAARPGRRHEGRVAPIPSPGPWCRTNTTSSPRGSTTRPSRRPPLPTPFAPNWPTPALNLWLLDGDALWRRICRRHFLNMKEQQQDHLRLFWASRT